MPEAQLPLSPKTEGEALLTNQAALHRTFNEAMIWNGTTSVKGGNTQDVFLMYSVYVCFINNWDLVLDLENAKMVMSPSTGPLYVFYWFIW